MKNLKLEIEKHINGEDVNSIIIFHQKHVSYDYNLFVLKPNHTKQNYHDFLTMIDFEFDLKTQDLDVFIWLKNGIYLTNISEWFKNYYNSYDLNIVHITKEDFYAKFYDYVTRIDITNKHIFSTDPEILINVDECKIEPTEIEFQGDIWHLEHLIKDDLKFVYDISYSEDNEEQILWYEKYIHKRIKENINKLREIVEQQEQQEQLRKED